MAQHPDTWSRRLGLALAVVLVCTAFPSLGETITVGRTNSDYTRVQQAVNAAQYGDTVLVKPGSYYGTVKMKDGVTLLASDDGEVKLYSDYSPVIMADGTIGAELSGFVIEYTGTTGNSAIWVRSSPMPIIGNEIRGATYSGIHVTADAGCGPLIQGNRILRNQCDGIYVEGNAQTTILSNDICANGGSGIHSVNGGYPIAESNVIHDNGENGVIASGSSGGDYRDNRVFGNRERGFHVTGTSTPDIAGNTISGNGREGISIVRTSRFPPAAHHIYVVDNEICDHPHAGIFLGQLTEVYVARNVIHGNFEGICVSDEVEADARENSIYKNRDAGIEIRENAVGHLLENMIHNNEKCGVFAWGAASGEIRDNQINGNGEKGVYLIETATLLVQGNEITGNAHEGISIVGSVQRTASDNQISGNGFAGIFVGETASATLTENVLAENLHEGICIAGDATAIVRGNSVSSNVYMGIRTQDSATGIIESNMVSGNTEHGIFNIGSSSGEIRGNTIRDNVLDGVSIQDDASFVLEDNVISGNGQSSITMRGYVSPEIVAATCPAKLWIGFSNPCFSVAYHDADGDLCAVQVEILEGPLEDFTADLAQLPNGNQVIGAVDGELNVPFAIVEPGYYRLRITLIDALRLVSSAYEVGFDALLPNAPEVLGVQVPQLTELPVGVVANAQFKDLDGDLSRAEFKVLGGPLVDFSLDLTEAPYAEQVVGQTEGAFLCEIVPSEPCTYTVQLTLVDAAGLESEPYEFSFEAYAPTAPVVDRMTFPTSIGVGEDQNGLVRFEDPDGDIFGARFEIIEGDPSTIEIDPGLSFEPEVEGDTDGAFRFAIRVNQPQTITMNLTLVDAAGLESDPYEFTFEVR